MSTVAQRLEEIRSQIHPFASNAGQDVTLVAVSKTKPDADLLEAYDAGQRDFGENRVQELAGKAERLPKDIRWHMIGHVQTNKIKDFLPFVHLVHGVDRKKCWTSCKRRRPSGPSINFCFKSTLLKKQPSLGLTRTN